MFLVSLFLPAVSFMREPIPGWIACVFGYPFYLGNLTLAFCPFFCRVMQDSARKHTLLTTFGVVVLLHAGWCILIWLDAPDVFIGFFLWTISYFVLGVTLLLAARTKRKQNTVLDS
jgi:hypothetical protein